jgi:TPR repeat protein
MRTFDFGTGRILIAMPPILALLFLALANIKKPQQCHDIEYGPNLQEKYKHLSLTELDTLVKTLQAKALQEDAEAEAELGEFYQTGYDVPKDIGKALQWYRKAADQGNAKGLLNIGASYLNSDSCGWQEYVDHSVNAKTEAYFWYSLAVARDSKYNNTWSEHKFSEGLTSEQIATVKERVEGWKPISSHVVRQ